MKNIYITESQLKQVLKLKETINQVIDKKPGESIDNAIKNADREASVEAPNADINYVIPKDELKEDVGDTSCSYEDVASFILQNWGEQIDDTISVEEIKNMIQDAYIEVCGEEIDYSNEKLFNDIMNIIYEKIDGEKESSVMETIVLTKKQIKEAKRNKRISESKVLKKIDIINSL